MVGTFFIFLFLNETILPTYCPSLYLYCDSEKKVLHLSARIVVRCALGVHSNHCSKLLMKYASIHLKMLRVWK